MSRLSTHVLDLSRGKPAAGIRIDLFQIVGEARTLLRSAVTDSGGRTDELLAAEPLPSGVFELVFHAAVAIRFGIDGSAGSYHVPLLLSPYGYSTYRGS